MSDLLAAAKAEALELLDEMNAAGRIEYGDYSRLHDVVSEAFGSVLAKLDRETLRDEFFGWPIGSGYYQTTVAPDEARDMADAVLALLGGDNA